MVMEFDVECSRGRSKPSCGRSVGSAGRRIARWMIVTEDERGRPKLERPAENDSRIEARSHNRSAAHPLVAEKAIGGVQEENMDLLHRLVSQRCREIVRDRIRR